MISVEERDEIIGLFNERVNATVAECCTDVDLLRSMRNDDVEEIRNSIFKIQNCIVAAVPEGIKVPRLSLYITPAGGEEIDVVTLSLGNKLTANKKFKYQYVITQNCASTEEITSCICEVYTRLIVNDLAEKNLADLNEVLAKITKAAQLQYGVEVTTNLGVEGKTVSHLSNDLVEFVADEDRVFELDDILIVAAADGEIITEEMIEDAIKKEAEAFAVCQTPVQLVDAHGGPVISYIANINKQVKAMTMIKRFCSKEYSKVRGKSDAVAFFRDGDVYAIVSRTDGKFSIMLDAFDVNTLRKADYDVLAAIRDAGFDVR